MDNRLTGSVVHIRLGATDAIVDVKLAGGETLRADIPVESLRYLALAQGSSVIAVLKKPWVTIETNNFALSGRNKLEATVSDITIGAKETEVQMRLKGGSPISAIVDNERGQSLDLCVGKSVIVIIKAVHVTLLPAPN